MKKIQIADFIGKRFGRGIVIKFLGLQGKTSNNKKRRSLFLLKCDCGKEYKATFTALNTHVKQSCGCLQKEKAAEIMKQRKNNYSLLNQKFGRGIVIKKIGLTPVGKTHNRIIYQTIWKLKCNCGNEYISSTSNLRSGSVQSCGCLRKSQADLLGQNFGCWKVLEKLNVVGENDDKKQTWKVQCVCGKICQKTSSALKHSRSCGCIWGFDPRCSKKITITAYIKNIKRGALERNLEFNLSETEIIDLLKYQDNKCALSGMEISLDDGSASLDRIDNQVGYIHNNIQWLHRNINMLKHKWPQKQLIEMCKAIAAHN